MQGTRTLPPLPARPPIRPLGAGVRLTCLRGQRPAVAATRRGALGARTPAIPQDRKAAEVYVIEHDLKGLLDELAQHLLIHMPEDPRAFLGLGRHPVLPPAANGRPGEAGVTLLRFVVECEGLGGTKQREAFSRMIAPRDKITRWNIEKEITRKISNLVWGRSAEVMEEEAETPVEGAQATFAAALENLRGKFDKFADVKHSPDPAQHYMSQAAFAKAMAAQDLGRTDNTMEDLMSRFDLNRDGMIDFNEFCIIINNNSDVEMVLKSLNIHRIMAAMMPKGSAADALSGFFDMNKAQVKSAILNAVDPVVELITADITKAQAVKHHAASAGASKFCFPLQGGPVAAFYDVRCVLCCSVLQCSAL